MFTTDELLKIQELPEYLRTDHCYNDLQHAMLVILFRHALAALKAGNTRYADQVLDNATLYLYIHFLNEEEGMVFKSQKGLIERNNLKEHSATHIGYLEHWKTQILLAHKHKAIAPEELAERLAHYYNVIIKHIEETDIHEYGQHSAITIEQTRHEMARIFETRMPMSPFMAGALDTVKILARDVADVLNPKYICRVATKPLGALNLISGAGRILEGHGSLRDRFAAATGGARTMSAHTQPTMLAA